MIRIILLASLILLAHQDLAPVVSPRKLVFNFDHCKQANEVGDPQQVGNEHAPVYYHFITPLKKQDYVMFRYDLIGYAYGAAQPLDITWVGYDYQRSQPVQTKGKNRNDEIKIANITSYYKGNNYLVLMFGPINRYCNGFSLYYQGHYGSCFKNGQNIDGYSLQVTSTSHPLA